MRYTLCVRYTPYGARYICLRKCDIFSLWEKCEVYPCGQLYITTPPTMGGFCRERRPRRSKACVNDVATANDVAIANDVFATQKTMYFSFRKNNCGMPAAILYVYPSDTLTCATSPDKGRLWAAEGERFMIFAFNNFICRHKKSTSK